MNQQFRKPPQLGFNFDELVIDSFAGGGGASTGIEAALGRPVDIAINHDDQAIAMHTVNHPQTRHYCESVWEVDPREACEGRPVGLAWFSPDCRHFSKAKGGTPVSPRVRGLAWVVLRWIGTVRPRVVILENVEEFKTWGPVVRTDSGEHVPCKKRRGQTFRSFINAIRRHGYQVETRELRACDYGAPTIRKRLFLIARCDDQPIVWPEPTHGPGLLPYRTAADIIDWSIPCPSIFERRRPLAENTLRRIARGIRRFVIDNPDPFIVNLTHGGRLESLSEPLRTVTGANRGEKALVMPYLTEHANASSQRIWSAEEPLRTQVASIKGGHFALVAAFLAKHYGGNYTGPGCDLQQPISTVTDHHALVTAHIQRQFGNSVGSDCRDPVGTVTAGGGGKSALVASHLLKLRGTCQDGQPVTEPAPTITAGGTHVGEVRAFLLKYYSEGGQWQALDEPMHTIPTKARLGLVMVHGEPYQIVDIGMRMLEPHELFAAQGFPPDYIIDRDATGKRITKTQQVAKCGNSVCPPVAEALVRANMGAAAKSVEAA